jgi:hypothetical protein
MIRSLFAVIFAVIAGLSAARLVEGAGVAVFEIAPLSPAYQGVLVIGWLTGAFAAALIALLLGRRWAPLGGLAAASVFLAAFIALISNPLSWLLWPGAALATGLGGFAAVMLTGAKAAHPALRKKDGLFDD